MEVLSTPILLFSLAIILAMAIERILEIIKSIYYYIDARFDRSARWTRYAKKLGKKLESRLDNVPQGDEHHFDLVLAIASRYLSNTQYSPNGGITISANKVRTVVMRLPLKIFSIILGLICAWLLQIDILELSRLAMQKPDAVIQYQTSWFGIAITGIAMGLGSEPLHTLINSFEKTRKLRKKQRGRNHG